MCLSVWTNQVLYVRVFHNECKVKLICVEFDKNRWVDCYDDFHGDPRQSLWRWRAHRQAEISGREASLIAPSGSENKRVAKLLLSKNVLALKLKSVMLHVTCMRARAVYSSR